MSEEYADAFALLVEQTKKHLKKHPNMSVGDFANGFLFPLFAASREETAELRADIDDVLDRIEIPDSPLLDECEDVIKTTDAFFKRMLAHLGWANAAGFTDAFPLELREDFVGLGGKMLHVLATISEARSAIDTEEEDEEEEDTSSEESDEEPAPLVAASVQALAKDLNGVIPNV